VIMVCSLGVRTVLLALENVMLYRPLRASQEWLPPPNNRVQDVELKTADGERIHAWWCPTEGWVPERGAVLYSHGNAGNLTHRAEGIKRWQQEMGQAALIYDYPGYGRSTGRPSEAGCYAAADAAYDWLWQERAVSPEHILLYGGSLGGGVAVELGSRRPHRALILVSTFTSIPDMAQAVYPWLPVRWLVRNRFDSLKKISRCHQPLFQAHGTADRVVPFRQGLRLFEAANEPKEFFTMPNYDHNHTPGPAFYGRLRKFLAKAEAASPNRRPSEIGEPMARPNSGLPQARSSHP
jgi:fermentation-respiration switch protein FrsA (DUF1100 family)